MGLRVFNMSKLHGAAGGGVAGVAGVVAAAAG
jgi:hypothetical protein